MLRSKSLDSFILDPKIERTSRKQRKLIKLSQEEESNTMESVENIIQSRTMVTLSSIKRVPEGGGDEKSHSRTLL